MKKEYNRAIYLITDIIRCIAIMLVISCHCTHLGSRRQYYIHSYWVSMYAQSIGTLGVVLFFFVSGLYYQRNTDLFNIFWRKKTRSLVIPWFITSILIYLYGIVRKGEFSFEQLVLEIIGTTSYTWYLSVTCILYMVFWKVKNNKSITIALVIASAGCSFIFNSNYANQYFKQLGYVLPFHWLMYFGFGILLSQYKLLEKLISIRKPYFYLPVIFFIFITRIIVCRIGQVWYLRWWFPIYAAMGLCSVIFLAVQVSQCHFVQNQCIKKVANASFPVYLLHMPIAGIIVNILNRFYFPCVVVRPFICLGLTCFFIYLIRQFAMIVHFKGAVDLAIGYRER